MELIEVRNGEHNGKPWTAATFATPDGVEVRAFCRFTGAGKLASLVWPRGVRAPSTFAAEHAARIESEAKL